MLPPDPATPERYPAVFVLGKCAACTHCWLDLRVGRCPWGGPYDANLRGAAAFIPLKPKEDQ